MKQGAAPAGGGMNAPSKLPGGAGAPPGDTTVPCQELADGGPLGSPEARDPRPPQRAPARVARGEPKRRVRKRGPALSRRRSGAPRGARILQKRMRHDTTKVRRSVLHPLGFAREKEEGLRPARGRKEYGRLRAPAEYCGADGGNAPDCHARQ